MCVVKLQSKQNGVFVMLTESDLKSHDDYENFAKYLGIDYDDFIEMSMDIPTYEDEEFVGIKC